MRAPFNTTAIAYAYPIGGIIGPPLTVAFPCRLVISKDIDQAEGWLPGPLTWVTTEVLLPSPAFTFTWPDETATADLTIGCVLAIPSGDLPRWVVLGRQVVTPLDGPPYYRYPVVLGP